MTEEIIKLDLKAIEEIILMHEDVAAALTSLPDFGYRSTEDKEAIERAHTLVNDLKMMLEYIFYTKNNYKETHGKLFQLLNEAGVSQCVDDLISVRRNSRRLKSEQSTFEKESFPNFNKNHVQEVSSF